MEELQKAADAYGIGMSVERLVDKMYWAMQGKGYNVYAINDRYKDSGRTPLRDAAPGICPRLSAHEWFD